MPKAIDLVVLDPAELESRLSEARHELFNLRFQLATGQLDNAARLGQVRRDVARILTVLREREIAEAEGTFVAPTAAQQETARARLAAEDEAVAAAQEAHARAHAHASHELEEEEPEEGEEEPEEAFDEEVLDEHSVAPVAAGAEVDHEEES